MSYGPPTEFQDFDQAAAHHAQTFETQATRIVSPEDLEESEEPKKRFNRPRLTWPLAIAYLAAEWVIWLIVWGFFRMLPLAINPELVPLVNLFTSTGAITVAGLIVAAILLLLEQRLQTRVRDLKSRWIDGLSDDSDCSELSAIRKRLKQLSRARSSNALALIAYIFVKGL